MVRDYIVEVSMRTTKTILVPSCRSGAEAIRKAKDPENAAEDWGLDVIVDNVYWGSARAVPDQNSEDCGETKEE